MCRKLYVRPLSMTSRICDILKPETSLEEWQSRDQRLQQESERKIEAAYAQRKAELIEEARIRKQLALEKALAEKRAEEQAYQEQLRHEEQRKFSEQSQVLAEINTHLEAEVQHYVYVMQKILKRLLILPKVASRLRTS